ncbi:MAG: glycerol kinase GlpK [Bdellovibrionota bacterium]
MILMNHQFILSIDEGTTGVQASFFDSCTFKMYGNNKVEFPQIYPRAGLVEQNPLDIWHATLEAIRLAIEKTQLENSQFKVSKIACIGITNQRETCLAWNKVTGELAGNALVWQDRRTADFCNSLKQNETTRKNILNSTGLVCDPYFSASKMRWMLEHYPKTKPWLQKNELALGTVDSYVVWKLTSGSSFVTEHTNASRTMLYNIVKGEYDEELSKLFNVPLSTLPQINTSSGHFGVTKNTPHLPDGIPITGILGDQQAALFGQNCTHNGEAKITFGTGAFLLMNVGENIPISQTGLLTTVAHSFGEKRYFALEGAAFIAGAAVQFLRDNLGWVKNSAESANLAMGYPRDDDLFFVPSLAGLGAPYWNPNAKGVLFGLTRGTQKAQIIRAVLESIAFQNVQLLNLMEQACAQKIVKVGVDGGASRNDYLMQFQSDVLQVELVRPKNTETTSLGAAKAAWLGCGGTFQSVESEDEEQQAKIFTPQMPAAVASANLYRWVRVVECVNGFYRASKEFV